MTNHRINISVNDMSEFNYCFTCGSRLKEEITENPELKCTLTCARNWVHVRIFVYLDTKTEVRFC